MHLRDAMANRSASALFCVLALKPTGLNESNCLAVATFYWLVYTRSLHYIHELLHDMCECQHGRVAEAGGLAMTEQYWRL